ncbi:sporulation lipoprotein YhcN/YlaJ [Bacillus oleivorans]|uniref:Sporulation lipoprotein YhcN/YlaJ n=1 Tax=Bacillus oleivorans TaxID=1448271 RepID=A0A285CX47_9BACI|nr:YhcN/YlaJ family sporulation lipoprotein [Bacillus oleivorans]SNX71616.1 sporulation lipoprotein YhcN/YlaJ [Bacillus oleivorans]
MNRKIVSIPLTCLILAGVTACTTNPNGGETAQNDPFQRVGFYSNQDGGFMNNHRGPAQGLYNDPTLNRGQNKIEDYTYSDTDYNYHNHINNPEWMTQRPYFERYNGELANEISNRVGEVQHVRHVRTIVYNDTIFLGVQIDDPVHKDQVVHTVREAVIPYQDGRKIVVITDPKEFFRMREVDNKMRDGKNVDEINRELEELFSTYLPNEQETAE